LADHYEAVWNDNCEFTMTPHLPQCRILVVDDEPLVADAVRMLLTVDGHAVETAANGEAALAKFKPGKFDIILLDYEMPKMKGDQLANAIRDQAPHQPIIMLTAYGEMVRAKGTGLRAIDLIVDKPFQLDTLRNAIAESLAKHAGSGKA
jgi:CheY-like chemotaxis protein